MILLINGSFGIGKTTVSRILRRRIAASILFNPEWTGSLLMRLPLNLKGSGTDDFQDLDLWRKSVVKGVRIFRALARNTVIVPMAFSRKDYLNEILTGIRNFDNDIRIFCLKARFEVVLQRLANRGDNINGVENSWVVCKAKTCIEAHRDDYFGESVNTSELNPFEVADEIMNRLGQA
jgi:deoxyadenosine/deoxycytidine kinase